jgi:hypothetical protein
MSIPSRIPCFWIEPAGRIALYLRRYSAGTPETRCRYGYHNADVKIGERPSTNDLDDKQRVGMGPEVAAMRHSGPEPHWSVDYPVTHGAWPTKCDHCDYVFAPDDHWHYHARDVYRNPATGEEKQRDEFPAGAIYRATWYEDIPEWTGPDGMSLIVTVPDTLGRTRAWTPDVPSKDGAPWQRTGDPRRPETLTIRPSILFTSAPRFHAWLTNGQLEVLSDTEDWNAPAP